MPISLRTLIVLLSITLFPNFFCQAQNFDGFSQIDSLISARNYSLAKAKVKRYVEQPIDSLRTKAHLYMGKIELLLGNLDVSLSEYYKAQELIGHLDSEDKVNLFSGVGVIYSKSQNFEDAIISFQQALKYAEKDINRLKILVNLGGVSMEAGNDQVASIYDEALDIAEKLNQSGIEAIIYTNLSNYYLKENSWKSAIESAKRSLQIRDSLNMPISVITLNNLGYALVKNGNINEGIKNYNKALEFADLQEKIQILYNLRGANIAAGNYKKALQYYDRYDSIKDIVAKTNYKQKIADIRATFETAENEKKISLLETENKIRRRELLWVISGGVFILLLLGFGGYYRMKHVKVQQRLEQSRLRSKFLRLQLNPHFLFNALQQVQFYIYRNERETSMEYLDKFGKLIRSVLEHSDSDFIKLIDEVDMLENYLSLQENAIAADFSFSLNCDPLILTDEISIPVMLLQPFVENAVIHGAGSRPENARVEVVFKKTKFNDKIRVEIIDNGTGIKNKNTRLQHTKLHKSMGHDILKERIKELNRLSQIQIDVNIENATKEMRYPGTRVSLIIPYVHI